MLDPRSFGPMFPSPMFPSQICLAQCPVATWPKSSSTARRPCRQRATLVSRSSLPLPPASMPCRTTRLCNLCGAAEVSPIHSAPACQLGFRGDRCYLAFRRREDGTAMTESYLIANTCNVSMFPQSYPTFVTSFDTDRTSESNEPPLTAATPAPRIRGRRRRRPEGGGLPPGSRRRLAPSGCAWLNSDLRQNGQNR